MRKGFVLAALIGLVACGQAVSSPAASVPKPKPFHPPSGWGLFVTDRSSFQGRPWQLMRLDAGSLKDAQVAAQGTGYAVASADGSTLVEIDYNADQTTSVRVVAARTGTVRTSFQPPFAVAPVLTPDGSRLLVIDSTGHSWRVFNTSDGQLTGKLETDGDPCCGLFGFWLDPTGRFLYRVLVSGSGFDATGPVTPIVARYDLEAGRETGRLKLDGIEAGLWQTARTIGSEHVTTSLVPGVALSLDGSQLSVLYADGDRLMTIDTATLKIVASRHVAAPQPPTSWFSIAPVDAYAKYDEGVQWNLAYSPDGRQLVAAARQTTIDNGGNYSTSGLGLKVIDPQSATLTAQVPNIDVGQFLYAPDGSALYATTLLTDGVKFVNQAHMVLLRLDPSSLAVAARREFVGPRDVLLLARS